MGALLLMPMLLDVSLFFFYCVGMDKDSPPLLSIGPLPYSSFLLSSIPVGAVSHIEKC